MQIVSDIRGLDQAASGVEAIWVLDERRVANRWKRLLRVYLRACRCDYAVLHFHAADVLLLVLLLWITPFHKCRVVTLDIFLQEFWLNKRGVMGKLLRILLNRVYLYLVYVRDTSAYQRLLGLKPNQFRYIPFKINAYEIIQGITPSDQGYIFCGGRSRRDFATFFQAVAALGYPVKLVTAPEPLLRVNGSSMESLSMPPNVELILDDENVNVFVGAMAGARLVVIPIRKGVLTQAGIAVYLMAMALGKCVIVSSGPGVDDVLRDEAIIVPAGEPEVLRRAIETAWTDETLRAETARRGFEYASALGGEQTLLSSILKEVRDDAKVG